MAHYWVLHGGSIHHAFLRVNSPCTFTHHGIITGKPQHSQLTRYPELARSQASARKYDLFWMSYGLQDPNHVPAEAFAAGLAKNSVKCTYVTREGGHVWPVWRWSLAQFAPLFFRNR